MIRHKKVQGQDCEQCQRIVHPSNLVNARTCLYCTSPYFFMPGVGISNRIARIYKFTPIISLTLSLIVLFAIPAYNQTITFEITAVVISLLCLCSVTPYIMPILNIQIIKEVEHNLETRLNDYIPEKPSFCTTHPDIEAIGRCGLCFKPFCQEDFYYIRGIPSHCKDCGKTYMKVNFLPLTYMFISIGLISIIGIINEIIKTGVMQSIFIFLVLFLFIFGIFLIFSLFGRMYKLSQPRPP
ncbi:MAG TPA: hypothetical protein VMV49_18785 [Candidatus Deferrimicrobium sp.]|nr:hypothetical protein [Candidatus Deferrimicrobium sp.]